MLAWMSLITAKKLWAGVGLVVDLVGFVVLGIGIVLVGLDYGKKTSPCTLWGCCQVTPQDSVLVVG